ncbi:MAG: hypothetical protein SFV51_21415 [Bryobacteraceae bacterium]|nr:hypothetical protein [Bryobacteraceae bacterium]
MGKAAMDERFHYDAVVKDIFQQDRPSLGDTLAAGRKVRGFLNPEFSVVEKRVADLLILLEGDTILHLDFQSNNHRDMAYREGFYGLMAARKYRCRVEQTVLYMGRAKMRMADRLDTGGIQVSYRLIDIREFDAETLLNSGRPGDYALALLARGGVGKLRQIVQKANKLPGPQRQRVLTQLAILSGLRGASERLTMEFRTMGISVEINENVFLKNIYDSAIAKGRAEGKAEGKAEGRAEGKAEGMTAILRELLEAKFGPLPKWAADRLRKATPAQAERWARRVLTASTLEAAVGKR